VHGIVDQEQPRQLAGALGRPRLTIDHLLLDTAAWRRVDKVVLVGCGAAYHVGLVLKYVLGHWARLRCEVDLTSEYGFRDPAIDAGTLVVPISPSSTGDRSDATLGGGFLSQLTVGYVVALSAAAARRSLPPSAIDALRQELAAMPDKVEAAAAGLDPVRTIARSLVGASRVLVLGRHVGYPVALEAARLLRVAGCARAEGFAAGELKHGPIALIEDGTPVIVVLPPRESELRDKVISNIQEVRARGARTIVVADEADDVAASYSDDALLVPAVSPLLQPLLAMVPLRALAFEISG
jgi:glucosamine--fructose-6-phosphate aminotransferase (isomerizing)